MAETLESLAQQVDALRREIAAMEQRRATDRHVVRDLVIPHVEELRRTLKTLSTNEQTRTDAAVACVDAYHVLSETVRRLRATVAMFFRDGSIQ